MEFNRRELRKDVITKRCIDNDFSMDEASKQIGISVSVLSHLESPKYRSMTLETFCKLCAWLGTEPGKYFTTIVKL